jgi:hypothetical protein
MHAGRPRSFQITCAVFAQGQNYMNPVRLLKFMQHVHFDEFCHRDTIGFKSWITDTVPTVFKSAKHKHRNPNGLKTLEKMFVLFRH